jgi:hypothetical protein
VRKGAPHTPRALGRETCKQLAVEYDLFSRRAPPYNGTLSAVGNGELAPLKDALVRRAAMLACMCMLLRQAVALLLAELVHAGLV